MQLRDDLYRCGNQLSLAQLGVKPWTTLLLVGPVLRPRSFYDSDDAVVLFKSDGAGYVAFQWKTSVKITMEQECESLMINKKQKMA